MHYFVSKWNRADNKDEIHGTYLESAVSVELVDDYGVIHVVEFYVGEWDGFCVPLRTLWLLDKKNTKLNTALTFYS